MSPRVSLGLLLLAAVLALSLAPRVRAEPASGIAADAPEEMQRFAAESSSLRPQWKKAYATVIEIAGWKHKAAKRGTIDRRLQDTQFEDVREGDVYWKYRYPSAEAKQERVAAWKAVLERYREDVRQLDAGTAWPISAWQDQLGRFKPELGTFGQPRPARVRRVIDPANAVLYVKFGDVEFWLTGADTSSWVDDGWVRQDVAEGVVWYASGTHKLGGQTLLEVQPRRLQDLLQHLPPGSMLLASPEVPEDL